MINLQNRCYRTHLTGDTDWKFARFNCMWPVPVAARSKPRSMVLDRSNIGMVGSNPTSHSRQGCVSAFLYVVVSCVCRGFAIGRFPVQRVLTKCRKVFIVLGLSSIQERPEGLISETQNSKFRWGAVRKDRKQDRTLETKIKLYKIISVPTVM
jgi:hypothetical protein